MKKIASFAIVFAMSASFSLADTWAGRLVDAVCKVSTEGNDPSMASCQVTATTHLFGIELANTKMLILDALGNEKAADAVKIAQKTNPRAIVTGSRDGQMVKVEKIEVQ